MDRQSVLAQFETLLPLAAEWAEEEEQRVLHEGVPLSEQEMTDANAIGVRRPERIRLLRVEAVPMPTDPQLMAAAETMSVPSGRGRHCTEGATQYSA